MTPHSLQVTQEQKDAIFIYRAITEQQKTDNRFTAHKFYQRFVKRDEFLFPRQGGNHLKFNAPRFTPEYIYLRLLELSKLGLCELQADVYALTAPTEEDFNNPLLQLKDGYSIESCGINVVAISDDGTIEPLPHLGDSLSFLPIVPMDYPYTKPNEVTSVMDIEKAMPVMCFFFDVKVDKNTDTPVAGGVRPVIINIKNTTTELQRIQLFRKQFIPFGVEISSGIPSVSIDDILYQIQYEKHTVERTMLYIIRENKTIEPHEAYHGYLKQSDMNGCSSAWPICIAQQDFQYHANLLICETKYTLDFKTELEMDIKPNDEISISFYLSKVEAK